MGLTFAHLIDVAVNDALYFNATAQEGVMAHLIGALREFGKLGTVLREPYARTGGGVLRQDVEVLERESGLRVAPRAD